MTAVPAEPPPSGSPTPPPAWRVRPPDAADWPGIAAVASAAFSAKHTDKGPVVAGLVERLRNGWGSGRGFELVAATAGAVIGHIGMSRAYVDGVEELHHVLVLSPLSVDPAWQGRGIGTALVRAALADAQAAGWPLVFLEGEPSFYPRLGFVEAGPAGFGKPSVRIPDAAFMVHDTGVGPRTISGALVYPEAFWETDTTGLRGPVLRRLCPGLFAADRRNDGD